MYYLFGYLGGIFLSLQLYPQIYKVIKQKNADNLSLGFMICNLLGLLCMGIYGFSNNDITLLVSISISFTNTCILVILKLYYTNFPA